MDAFLIARLAVELGGYWGGARVQEVWQDEADRVILRLRGRGHTGLLLLSALPGAAGLGLVERRPPCPPRPPALAAFLRARARGGILRGARVLPYERVLELRLARGDEEVRVLLEATGRRGNLALCDGDGVLRAALRWEDETRSRLRPLLPGTEYRPPPDPRGLVSPERVTPGDLAGWVGAGDALHRRIAGLGPELAREIHHRAAQGELWAAFRSVVSEYGAPGPVWEYEGVLSAVELTHQGTPSRVHDHALAAAGGWLLERLRGEEEEDRGREERRQARRHRERLERRIAGIRGDLEALPDVEELRARAESFAAQLWAVPSTAREVRVPDLRDPKEALEVDLDPSLSPGQNLDRLYREVGRTERKRKNLERRLAASERELLEGRAPPRDPKATPGAGPGRREPYRRYVSSDGWPIWVGRNGAENDRLLREARPWDLWLHARGGSGAHVLLRMPGRDARPPDRTVTEAAGLAAWYSRARPESAVDVMVAEACRVHKPKGASPGRVVVAGERTVRVPPGAGSPRAAEGAQGRRASAR